MSHPYSQLLCMGRHTITGLLSTQGRVHQDWSADYRLYSNKRLDPQVLFDCVKGELRLRGVLSPILGAPACQLLVIAPLGYRPRAGSKLLYRQPAYLLCTDPKLSLRQLLQYYLWRWDLKPESFTGFWSRPYPNQKPPKLPVALASSLFHRRL